MIECSESILTSIDVFVVINILSNRSKWTFYFLSSVQFNFTIGEILLLVKFFYLVIVKFSICFSAEHINRNIKFIFFWINFSNLTTHATKCTINNSYGFTNFIVSFRFFSWLALRSKNSFNFVIV